MDQHCKKGISMSIEASNTADFFYLGGVVRGLANEGNSALGSITVGLMAAVSAINLRDRVILNRTPSHILFAAGSLLTEGFQAFSGVITGIGIKTLYRASLQTNMKLANSGIAAVFAGAALSACAMGMHKYLRGVAVSL